jgi:hypothetical protein
MSDPPAFGVLYLVKYYGGFIYFISHAIKNCLKNVATLVSMPVTLSSFCFIYIFTVFSIL